MGLDQIVAELARQAVRVAGSLYEARPAVHDEQAFDPFGMRAANATPTPAPAWVAKRNERSTPASSNTARRSEACSSTVSTWSGAIGSERPVPRGSWRTEPREALLAHVEPGEQRVVRKG